jgi:hypothetical protein
MEFVLQAASFVFELPDYILDKCFRHSVEF